MNTSNFDVEDFVKFWLNRDVAIPNPDHFPRQFAYMIKVYNHSVKKTDVTVVD